MESDYKRLFLHHYFTHTPLDNKLLTGFNIHECVFCLYWTHEVYN
jgi:hypothetical protein